MDVSPCQEGITDILAATFSPSIFSPDDKSNHRPATKDIFAVSSMFPLFGDITSPPGFGIGEHFDDRDDHHGLLDDDHSKMVANTKKVALLAKLTHQRVGGMGGVSDHENVAKNINAISESNMLMSKRDKMSSVNASNVRPITLKNKKLNKNLVVTPESTFIPPALSPDLDSSRKLSLDHMLHMGENSQVDSDSSTQQMSSTRKSSAAKGSGGGGSLSNRTTCNCKKSKCLKLYCDCFAVLNYCDPHFCNCVQCYNVSSHEEVRTEAIKATKERNVLAFKTKISEQEQHVTGCHCKNSHCLKKYCECFNGSALCGINCKCQSCQNYQGSAELAKTRESSPKIEPGSAGSTATVNKKRKESPNSIVWGNGSPEPQAVDSITKPSSTTTAPPQSIHMVNMATQQQQQQQSILQEVKKTHYSLRPTKESVVKTTTPSLYMTSTLPPVPSTTPVHVLVPFSSSSSSSNQLDTILPTNSDKKLSTQSSTVVTTDVSSNRPTKKRKVKFSTPSVTYPFFGEKAPEAPKYVALKVLDFLNGKELYAMSQVCSLWNNAVLDDAMWE